MPLTNLQATVTIGGQSYAGYLISVQREAQIAKVSQTFTIECSLSTPYAPVPFADVVITEDGETVLTGYLDSAAWARLPDKRLTLQGRDKFKLAEDFYITDHELAAKGETVGYWIDTLCDMVGLPYLPLSSGSSLTVGYAASDGVPMGMMTVAEALQVICAVPGWNMLMTAAGELELLEIGTPTDPEIVAATDGSYTVTDENTRNVAKIWGAIDGESQLLYQDRVDIDLLTPDRIMLLSSQGVSSLALAQELTGRLLDHFGNLDEISSFRAPAVASRRVGDGIQVELLAGTPHASILTDLTTKIGPAGYEQSMATGRKNFVMPWYPTVPVESGDPALVWEVESVLGEARNLWIFGGHVYLGGWTYHNQDNTTYREWRLEKRQISDGTLVWAQTITDVTNGASTAPANDWSIRGVYADANGVFISGSDGIGYGGASRTRWRIQCRAISDGALTWDYTYPDPGTPTIPLGRAGNDIVGDGTYLYAVGTVSSDSYLLKLNYAGTLVDSEQLLRDWNGVDAEDQENVRQVSYLQLDGSGLLLAGAYNAAFSPVSFTARRWLARYSTALAKVWEYQFGYSESPSFGLTSAWGDASGIFALTQLTGSVTIGGLHQFTTGGSLSGTDTGEQGVNLTGSNNYVYLLYRFNSSTAYAETIHGWKRAISDLGWTLTPGARYYGIRFYRALAYLLVSGQKNSNFYAACYRV